jgi:hypothetical protein
VGSAANAIPSGDVRGCDLAGRFSQLWKNTVGRGKREWEALAGPNNNRQASMGTGWQEGADGV